MRASLQSVGTPDHVGLAYDAWAPVGQDGKVPVDKRDEWLTTLENIVVSPDYARSFARWKASLETSSDCVFELVTKSRLLVGHGNSSGLDVGLTVHHTWGVPIIPGSALKGLLAHYVDAKCGPDGALELPWEQQEAEPDRAEFRGVTWKGRRILWGPGGVYRTLFGAPDAEGDAAMQKKGLEAGATAGLVRFHDALYVPADDPAQDRPFAADVLTVHQKKHYDSEGDTWPIDYDSPNPVGFLSVQPGARIFFALSGPTSWTALTEQLLRRALEEWGVGGKTSAGYGRLVAPEQASSAKDRTPPVSLPMPAIPTSGEEVEAILLEERTKHGSWKARHVPSGLAGHIYNSSDVPAAAKHDDCLILTVATVSVDTITFRFPVAKAASVPKKAKRKGKRRRGRS